MKIKKEAKGLIDLSHIYNPDADSEAFYEALLNAQDEDADRAAEEMHDAEVQEREVNARAQMRWEEQAEENLKIIRDVTGEVGKRLEYLFQKKNIEKAAFARQIGIGRTTLHRYLSGSAVPNEGKLRRIIEALEMDIGDFCYEPKNTAKWTESLEESARKRNDIFELKNELFEKLAKNNFTYTYKGSTYRLPYKHYVVLKEMLDTSFRVLDLLAHDK